MKQTQLEALLKAGEGRCLEFKASQSSLSKDVYETVCAFLNREGGDILLGVKDDGSVLGVDEASIAQQKADFATAVNNSQKLNPPCYLTLQEVEYAGETLLHVFVPPGSQVHRCKDRIYDRNEDADIDITDQQEAVAKLYSRKQSTYSENTIYPHATMAQLRLDLIQRARQLAVNHTPNHPWGELDDISLLRSAQLWKQDLVSGVEGLTLAAILLFGQDETILSVLPHHRTDAILRCENLDRYDDRDDIRTNLLESRDRLFAFGEKHLSSAFHLEKEQRVDVRDWLLREIIGNLLIHREFSDAFPAKMVIERGLLFTENGNRPHGHGLIDPESFSPFPKNPAIARVFKEIGWADELGSGVRNLTKYGQIYGGSSPQLREDNCFRLELKLPALEAENDGNGTESDGNGAENDGNGTENDGSGGESGGNGTENDGNGGESGGNGAKSGGNGGESGGNGGESGGNGGESGGNDEKQPPEIVEKILSALAADKHLTAAGLAERIGQPKRSVERHLAKLKESKRIKRHGGTRGYWEIL